MKKASRSILSFRFTRTIALPLVLLLILISSTFVLYLNLSEKQDLELQTTTKITTEQAGKRLESWVKVRTHVLWQVVDRVPPLNGGSSTPFVNGAFNVILQHSGLLAVNWINKDLTIAIVVPTEGNEKALGRSLKEHPDPEVRRTLDRVLKTKAFAATPPVELLQGGAGIAAYLPVYDDAGKLLGLVNGVFRIREMVDAALPEPELRSRFRLALIDENGKTRVNLGDLNLQNPSRFVFSYPINLFDQSWTLVLEPYPGYISEFSGRGKIFFLVLGFIFALAISGFLHLLLMRQDLLREKESRYRSLFERSRDAIYLSQVDGQIIDANKACQELLRYTLPEVRRLDANMLYQSEDVFDKLIASLTDFGFVQDVPATLIRRDGKTVSCLMTASYFLDATGAIEGIQWIIRDISEKLELEEKFHQAQKMEALGRLAGGIAHDFNNLLTAQFGQVELIRSALPPNSAATPYVQDFQDTTERAAELTRRLLAFSRKQPVKPRLVNLNEVIRSAEKLLGRLISEDVTMTIALGNTCGYVNVDPVQVEQVLFNLVVNARDAMQNGGELTIRTECIQSPAFEDENSESSVENKFIRMIVTDSGTGIPPEIIPHIFEPYFTTKPETKGTGLGLATVFGVMEQLHGRIDLKSTMGEGTTFFLDFPISMSTTDNNHDSESSNGPFRGKGVILIVEDDDSVRLTTQELLRTLGYVVESASTPEEGIRQCEMRNGELSLLLTDIVMPGMSGPEMIKKLRERYPRLRYLYMSGHTPQDYYRRGLLGPNDDILQKPFTVRELAERIHEKMI